MVLLVVLTCAERQNGHEVGGGAVAALKSVGIVMSVRDVRLVHGKEFPQLLVLGKIAREPSCALDR